MLLTGRVTEEEEENTLVVEVWGCNGVVVLTKVDVGAEVVVESCTGVEPAIDVVLRYPRLVSQPFSAPYKEPLWAVSCPS